MLKKIIISTLILLVFSTSFLATEVKAQEAGGTWYNQTFQEWYSKVYDNSNSSEIFGERYTAAQVQWIIYGLFAFVLNTTTGSPETTTCLMNNDVNDCIDRLKDLFNGIQQIPNQQGLNTQTKNTGFLATLFADRPLSAITYFKDTARSLKLIPEAEAQSPNGFGFNALDPVLQIWRASRNLAYGLFVIVILVLSFMIMFRVKISPQVVISVQSALPKIALALILVTFSYAIAGFLVDIMYVVIGLISLFISQTFSFMNWVVVPSPNQVFGFLTQGVLGMGILGVLGLYMLLFVFASILGLLGVNGLGGLISGLTGLDVVFAFLALLLIIIVAVLLIFISLKIMWMLIKAFATVLLLVIAAPFQIALGTVVPGLGFGSWLRTFLSNLAVFPFTGLMLSLAYIFLFLVLDATFKSFFPSGWLDFVKQLGFGFPGAAQITGAFSHQGWPPLLVFGVQNATAVIYLGASIIVLFLTPKGADIIKGMIEGRPFAYGTAIGEAFGPASWAYGKIQSSGAMRAYQEMYGSMRARSVLKTLGRQSWWPQQDVLGGLIPGKGSISQMENAFKPKA